MLDAGQQFAHFTIINKLGEGGMGAVYLAEDQKLHRQVALKTLTAEYFDRAEGQERFQREARTAAQINHPNVMAIYDFGDDKDARGRTISYIVMEYIKGHSLSTTLKDGKVDMSQTLRFAEKIASGLAAAHKLGIVHRDIKPENIFIDENGEPKILDFGLAKPVNPVQMEGGNAIHTVSQELTKVGKILGTVSYMSPEQVRGEAVDQRSDVFAFGILLYRMATGILPFSGSTQVSTLAKILEAPYEAPHIKNENIPAELERIIDKCLQKDPNDRYQDTRDLVVDLRNLRKQIDSGVTETISTTALRQKKEKKKFQLNWKWVALLGCAIPVGAVTLIALVGILFNGFSSDEDKAEKLRMAEKIAADLSGVRSGTVLPGTKTVAILSFDNKTNDTTLGWLESGLPEILATDLSQHHSMEIINPSRLEDFVAKQGEERSREAYVEAAQSLGASTLLSGSYFKMGPNIRIDARLEDLTSGKIMLAEKVIGADPFTLVDSLTHKMSASLNVTDQASGETSSDILTSSPEAYKHYIVGLDYFLDEKFDESIREFEQSIALDSDFALPYMRIGMANAFQQRPQQGARYFAMAKRHEAKLPLRERGLLDVYADLWLKQKFQDAFTKLTTLADNYPNDKEILAVDGLLIWAFNHDTTTAFKMFDSSLTFDPGFQLSLGQKSSIYEQLGNFEAAVKLIETMKKFHPDGASVYSSLGRIYRRMQRYDEAIAAYQDFDRRFPSISDGLWGLERVAVLRRDFDEAERQLDQIGRRFKDNPFEMYEFYGAKVSLCQWRGQFRTALSFGRKQIGIAKQTKDSSYVFNAMSGLSSQYYNYGMMDSALAIATEANVWAPIFAKMSYPIQVAARNRAKADSVRPMLIKTVETFKSRIPSNLWPVGDGIKEIFEGYAAADTQRVINALKSLIAVQSEGNDQNLAELGQTQIRFRQYAEGKKLLERFVSGPKETGSGFNYLYYQYLIGVANEGLGDKAAAADCYRQMLSYWSKPDIELTEIKDARARLAKLTS